MNYVPFENVQEKQRRRVWITYGSSSVAESFRYNHVNTDCLKRNNIRSLSLWNTVGGEGFMQREVWSPFPNYSNELRFQFFARGENVLQTSSAGLISVYFVPICHMSGSLFVSSVFHFSSFPHFSPDLSVLKVLSREIPELLGSLKSNTRRFDTVNTRQS